MCVCVILLLVFLLVLLVLLALLVLLVSWQVVTGKRAGMTAPALAPSTLGTE